MRNLVHKAFCNLGMHRWTDWVINSSNRPPLPPNADAFAKLMHYSDSRTTKTRHCVLCGRKESHTTRLFP